jgi:hypothetical protein
MSEVPFFSQTLKTQNEGSGGNLHSKESSRRTQIMVSGLEVFTEKGFHIAHNINPSGRICSQNPFSERSLAQQ